MNEKTIFVFGKTKEQVREYVRTNVKIVTNAQELRGYVGQILIILPQEKEQVMKNALARDFKIMEA